MYLPKLSMLTLLPDFLQSLEQVEVEYVPEKAELDGEFDEEFRKVFERFTFTDAAGSEVKIELCSDVLSVAGLRLGIFCWWSLVTLQSIEMY